MASVNAAGKSTPKEAQIMAAILKDMGVNEYEPRVVNQMMEFSYREYMFHSRKHHSRVRANVRKGTADSAPPRRVQVPIPTSTIPTVTLY